MRIACATIMDLLLYRAEERPDAPALQALAHDPLTYAALLELVRDTGSTLRGFGCAPDDRIAVVMGNGPEMATACLAISSIGVCVPLNPDYTAQELSVLMHRLRVTHVVAGPEQVAARDTAGRLELPLIQIQPGESGRAGHFILGGPGDTTPAVASSPAPAPRATDVAMVLHTSGSTAEPKIVPLTHRNLMTSARNVVRSLGLGPRDVCLSTMPLFHIGALVDLLLAPLSAGGSVVVARSMSASDFFAHLEAFSPTWYQGVPTVLMEILRRSRSPETPVTGGTTQPGANGSAPEPATSLRFIRSVSSPCPPHVIEACEHHFGIPVIEIYGMTETAGVITSNPMPPGTRRPGSVGVPVGPEVLIVDAAGNASTPGRRGEVVVRGDNVMPGYEAAPGEDDGFWNGWLKTGDEGYLDDDGFLFLTGRIKELINRGGEKISPVEVDETVLAHPDVQDAAAFAYPHPTLGEEVALAVVPRAGRDIEKGELTAFCADRLAPFKVPRSIYVCDSLPRAPGGKLQRNRLAAWCAPEGDETTPKPSADDPASATSGSQPLTEASPHRGELTAIWRELLGVDEVRPDDDFFDLGGDSLRSAELVQRLRDRFGVELPPAALFDNPTIAQLEPFLERAAETEVDPYEPKLRTPPELLDELRGFLTAWYGHRPRSTSLLVGWNTLGTRPPLFWGAQSYTELADFAAMAGEDQPVYGMRSLFEARTKSADNLTALARRYTAEILDVQPEGPLLLGGYCAGAGVAFRIARALRSRGREVASLCLMEHYTPEAYDGRTAFFFNVDSGWHPFHGVDDLWRDLYTGPLRLNPTHATHAGILTDPDTMWAIRRELTEAVESDTQRTAGPPASPRAAALPATPPAATRKRRPIVVKARAPRFMASRRVLSVAVDIDNRGAVVLPAGTRLYDRWRRLHTRARRYDGNATLEHDLLPGERTRIHIRMRLPLTPGWWRLDFDVVPEANVHLAHDPPVGGRSAWLLPGRAVVSYLRRRLPSAARSVFRTQHASG